MCSSKWGTRLFIRNEPWLGASGESLWDVERWTGIVFEEGICFVRTCSLGYKCEGTRTWFHLSTLTETVNCDVDQACCLPRDRVQTRADRSCVIRQNVHIEDKGCWAVGGFQEGECSPHDGVFTDDLEEPTGCW